MDITRDYSDLCSMIAGASYKAMLEHFPLIRNIPVEHWYFFVSVLAFRLMADVTNASQPSFEKREMANTKSYAKLVAQYAAFPQGLAALQKYIDRNNLESITPEDLGLWLTANLFGKDPSDLSGQEIEVGNFTVNIIVRHLSLVGATGPAEAP